LACSEAVASALEYAEAGSFGGFGASVKQPLQANADTQKGSALGDLLFDGLAEAALFKEGSSLEVRHAGKDDLVGALHSFGIVGCQSVGTNCGQCLHHGREIAGLVIDDGDHKSPFVLGSILPSCLSREQATRKARAKALKRASTLWWLERPYMVLRWTLARAPREKPSRKS